MKALTSTLLVQLCSLLITTAVGKQEWTCSRNISTLQEIQAAQIDIETPTDFTMCVKMSPGNHYINYTRTAITYNVIPIGSKSTVWCDPFENSSTLPLRDYIRFPFIFTNSSLVRITNIHFEGCMRPLQFKEVISFQLVNASFRYDLVKWAQYRPPILYSICSC